MTVSDVRDVFEYIVNLYINEPSENCTPQHLKSVSGYYRITAEEPVGDDSRDLVTTDLRTYKYMDLILGIQALTDEDMLLVRDVLNYTKDWCYRYGSRKRKNDKALPDTGDRLDFTDDLVQNLNDYIRSNSCSINDVTLALELAYEIFEYDTEVTDKNDTQYNLVIDILNTIEENTETNSNTVEEWDILGGIFYEIENQIHANLQEEVGKSIVRRELESFDGDSISEFLKKADLQ